MRSVLPVKDEERNEHQKRDCEGYPDDASARSEDDGYRSDEDDTARFYVEAAVGVLLVMGVAAGFTVVSTGPPPSTAELDTLAHDAATVLASEPAEGGRDALEAAPRGRGRAEGKRSRQPRRRA